MIGTSFEFGQLVFSVMPISLRMVSISPVCMRVMLIDRSIQIGFLSYVNTQVVQYRSFILKNKFFSKTGDKGIDDIVIGGKDRAIIHVKCDDAVIANEETGVSCGLMKLPIEQALDKVLIPIEGSLLASIQILFELNEIAWICELLIIILAKFLFDQAIVPALWYLHIDWVIELSL